MSKRIASLTALLAIAGLGSAAGEVSFTAKPSAARAGDGAKIAFAVSAPTDVEVAVLSADGKVVRHLAAGALGAKNPPPEPLKAGLAQTLEWDGRDDFGKPVAGATKVRVRAGTGAKFGRFIEGHPNLFGAVNSIALDEDGNLYVMTADGGTCDGTAETLRVFDPEGRYLRTLVPFPADLAPAAAGAMARWDESSKSFRPSNRCSQMPAFYPWGGAPRIAGASKKAGVLLVSGPRKFRIDPNGGNVKGPLPMWAKGAKTGENVPQLAFSPDGKYIFYSNVCGSGYDTKSPAQIDANWPNGRVYRQDLAKPGSDPEKFYDLELPDWQKAKYWMPNAWNCRSAAYHVAADSKGHVHIGDLVNQEIVEVDGDGRKVGATKVATPERFCLDEKADVYYVLSRLTPLGAERSAVKLVKIAGRGAGAKVAGEFNLNMGVGRGGAGMCLSRSGEAVLLWILAGRLACVKDAGGKMEFVRTDFNVSPDVEERWGRIASDYGRDEIYTSDHINLVYRYDGKTGQGGLLKKNGQVFHAVDLAVGYDGLLYMRSGKSYSGPLDRYTRDLAPAPFPSGSHVLGSIYSRMGVGNCEKGLGVGPRGECYISYMYDWNKYFLRGFGPDGKTAPGEALKGVIPKKADPKAKGMPEYTSVGPLPLSGGGVRVDLAGNIYLGMRLVPKDFIRKPGFEKDPAYNGWTGSIVRYPPAGGAVLGVIKEDEPAKAEGPKIAVSGNVTLVNATAVYPGVAPFSGDGYGGGGCCCVCRVPRFDVDRWGRLVFPNAGTNSVTLIDNAGNAILEFGAYGNADSQYVNPNTEAGKAGKVTVGVPEFPLAWPVGSAFTPGAIHTIDLYNRRVLRADLTWQAEETCEVR